MFGLARLYISSELQCMMYRLHCILLILQRSWPQNKGSHPSFCRVGQLYNCHDFALYVFCSKITITVWTHTRTHMHTHTHAQTYTHIHSRPGLPSCDLQYSVLPWRCTITMPCGASVQRLVPSHLWGAAVEETHWEESKNWLSLERAVWEKRMVSGREGMGE